MKFFKNITEKVDKDDIDLSELQDESRAVFDRLSKYYEEVGIYTLREIGREAGLKAVTTYSKSELTKKVALAQASNLVRLDLHDGERRSVSLEEALGLVKDYMNKSFIVNPISVQGVIEIFASEGWIRPKLIKDEIADIFIPMRIINDYGLRAGDFVKGKARAMMDANRLGLFKIDTINDMNADDAEREDGFNKRVDKPPMLISFDGCDKVHRVSGESPFIKGESKLLVNNDLSYEFMMAFRKQMIIPVGIMLDECEKKHVLVDAKKDYNVFRFNYLETLKVDEHVELLLKYVKTLNECVMVVKNADSLSKESIAKLVQACGTFERGSVSLLMFVNIADITDKINWMRRVVDSVYSA